MPLPGRTERTELTAGRVRTRDARRAVALDLDMPRRREDPLAVPTKGALSGTPIAVSGRQRAPSRSESAVRRFRQDPSVSSAAEVLELYGDWLDRQALAP